MSTGKIMRFRDQFTFVSKELTHYFPGHMSRGMQQMQKKLKIVDCIIEVHDARIPFSGRNALFKDTVILRPHILLLNKMDLADARHRQRTQERLLEEGVNKVLYTNCKQDAHIVIKKRLLPTVMGLINSNSRYHRSDVEDYNLMVIGVPNVGKSSLINALRRTHIRKGKATTVGLHAGVTRSVLEKIKIFTSTRSKVSWFLVNDQSVSHLNGSLQQICESPKIYVYDSPGILQPDISDLEVGMKLALCANLLDPMVGEDFIADYMLYWLNKHGYFKYVSHFGLPEPTDDIQRLLAHVARQQDWVLKHRSLTGGYEFRPNFNRAAQHVLSAFRKGELGLVNLDIDTLELPEKNVQHEPS